MRKCFFINFFKDGQELDSQLVMYPPGHARYPGDINGILDHKFKLLGGLALHQNDLNKTLDNLNTLEKMNNSDLQKIYDVNISYKDKSIDDASL